MQRFKFRWRQTIKVKATYQYVRSVRIVGSKEVDVELDPRDIRGSCIDAQAEAVNLLKGKPYHEVFGLRMVCHLLHAIARNC